MPDGSEELDRLLRRLRSLPARTWRGDVSAVRRLLAELVALGPPGYEPPDVPAHALPDAVAVIAREAMHAGNADAALEQIRRTLAEL